MEQVVMTSVHICLYVHRTTSTNVPKLRGSTIGFMLTDPMRTDCVPWKDISSLPFVIIESDSKKKTNSVIETRINMANIYKTCEYWNRLKNCPYTHKQRFFYRFLNDEVTFSEDNMQQLKDQLTKIDFINDEGEVETIECPKNLRRMKESEIKEKSEDHFTFQLFEHFVMGNGILAKAIREYCIINFASSLDDSSSTSLYNYFWLNHVCIGCE